MTRARVYAGVFPKERALYPILITIDFWRRFFWIFVAARASPGRRLPRVVEEMIRRVRRGRV